MSVTLLGTKKTTVSKTEEAPTVMKLTLYWGEMNNINTLMNLLDGSIKILYPAVICLQKTNNRRIKGYVVIGVERYFYIGWGGIFCRMIFEQT